MDEYENPTENYPLNPNGSTEGITAITSEDGRHLAMMPHPERTFLEWHVPSGTSNVPSGTPNVPKETSSGTSNFYPWFAMFQNAYNWCIC